MKTLLLALVTGLLAGGLFALALLVGRIEARLDRTEATLRRCVGRRP